MFSLSLQAICSFLTTPFQQDYAQHRRQLSTRRTTRSQQIFPSLPGCCCRSPSGSAAADVGLFGPPLSIYTPVFSSSSAMILCPSRVFMNHAHSGERDIPENQPKRSPPARPLARSSESARSLRPFAPVARTSRRQHFKSALRPTESCGNGAWRPAWPAERGL